MSSSELRYLIAANELAGETENVKQTDVANRLRVTKVSTYNAIERLREKGLIEYMIIIRFISAHLSLHCGTSKEQAYEDALNATCAFSDETRNGVANYIKSEMEGARHEPRI